MVVASLILPLAALRLVAAGGSASECTPLLDRDQ